MRSRTLGSVPISRASFIRRALASASEKVVSRTRASGFARARCAARWSATMVFPVPAEPAMRAGPPKRRSTSWRCAGWRKTVQRSHGYSSARASSSTSVTTRNAPLSVGMLEGVAGWCGGPWLFEVRLRLPARAAPRRPPPEGGPPATSTVSSVACRTSASHSDGHAVSEQLSSSGTCANRGFLAWPPRAPASHR